VQLDEDRVASLGFVRIEGRFELGSRRNALKTFDDLTILEQQQRWDRIDSIAGGQFGMVLDIDLSNPNAPFVFQSQFIDQWGDLTAGAAPGSPKIDQNWGGGLENIGIECLFGKFCCVSHEEKPSNE